MAPHSSTLVWKISWTEKPGRLQSMELHGPVVILKVKPQTETQIISRFRKFRVYMIWKVKNALGFLCPFPKQPNFIACLSVASC